MDALKETLVHVALGMVALWVLVQVLKKFGKALYDIFFNSR